MRTRRVIRLPKLKLVKETIHNHAMIRIESSEANNNPSRNLASVGVGETILLFRRNVPVAELRAVTKPRMEPKAVGIDQGMTVPSTFFEPLPDDLLDAFEGSPQ